MTWSRKQRLLYVLALAVTLVLVQTCATFWLQPFVGWNGIAIGWAICGAIIVGNAVMAFLSPIVERKQGRTTPKETEPLETGKG